MEILLTILIWYHVDRITAFFSIQVKPVVGLETVCICKPGNIYKNEGLEKTAF